MKILVADDHVMIREALVPLIEQIADDIEVIQASDFNIALERALEARELGLVILDLEMPGMNGSEGLRAMHMRIPEVPVVILSGTLNRATIWEMMRNGAAGYIPKTYKGEVLINALKLVISGEQFIPSLLVHGGEEPREDNPGRGLQRFKGLTNSEMEILVLLMDGLSNKEISRILAVKEPTVKKRLARTYRKLGVTNRTQAARIAIECLEDT